MWYQAIPSEINTPPPMEDVGKVFYRGRVCFQWISPMNNSVGNPSQINKPKCHIVQNVPIFSLIFEKLGGATLVPPFEESCHGAICVLLKAYSQISNKGCSQKLENLIFLHLFVALLQVAHFPKGIHRNHFIVKKEQFSHKFLSIRINLTQH